MQVKCGTAYLLSQGVNLILMLHLLPIATLGFLGSFGHCFGMCGPLAVAFSLSHNQESREHIASGQPTWQQQFQFHALLNLGRLLSYTLVGAGFGALGSILLKSGQLAGIGSELRQWMAIITGIWLIWFGVRQINPNFLPRMPFLHPSLQNNIHSRLSAEIVKLSLQNRWWTPALLGITWGFMPCGFLYAAQIKAAETGAWWLGAATMLAFGLGTLPTMLGVGVSAALVSKDRRSQLFRLGGWVTLTIGFLTLLRTGDTMVDYTGHAAFICLVLALIARPIALLWKKLLHYRRALGVGAFVLSLAHTTHMMEHSLQWNFAAFFFLPQEYQLGMTLGAIALVLMTPAALTSFDSLQKSLGKVWRQIHLLSIPALLLIAIHAMMLGSHYLGSLQSRWENQLAAVLLSIVTLGVVLIRLRFFWSIFSLEKFYVPSTKSRLPHP